MCMTMTTCFFLGLDVLVVDSVALTAKNFMVAFGTAASAMGGKNNANNHESTMNSFFYSACVLCITAILLLLFLNKVLKPNGSNTISEMDQQQEQQQQEQQPTTTTMTTTATNRAKPKQSTSANKDNSPDTDDLVNSNPPANKISKKSKPSSAPPSPAKSRKSVAVSTLAEPSSPGHNNNSSVGDGLHQNHHNKDDDEDCSNNDDDDDNHNSYQYRDHHRNKRSRRPSTSSNSSSASSNSSNSSSTSSSTKSDVKPAERQQQQSNGGNRKSSPSVAPKVAVVTSAAGKRKQQSPQEHHHHSATQNGQQQLQQAARKRCENTTTTAADTIPTKEKFVKRSTAELTKKEQAKLRHKENELNNNCTNANNNNKTINGNLETTSKKLGKRLRKKLNKNKALEEVLAETTTPEKTMRIATDEHKPINVENAIQSAPMAQLHPSSVISKTGEVFEDSLRSCLFMNDYEVWCKLKAEYVLKDEELYDSGFPVKSMKDGYAHCYRQNMRHKPLNPVAKEFCLDMPDMSSTSPPPAARKLAHRKGTTAADNGLQKQKQQQHSSNDHVPCVRCSSFYNVKDEHKSATHGRCKYHHGKYKFIDSVKKSAYDCCLAESQTSPGCTKADQHVWNGFSDGDNEIGNFVETVDASTWSVLFPYTSCVKEACMLRAEEVSLESAVAVAGMYRVFALDCEMCYTECGLEVTKVTLVDIRGTVAYDTLVKPSRPIVDYNTRYSGITAQHFARHPSKTLNQVRRDLLRYISSDTILVGHGLGTDLLVLRMIHPLVVDTSLLFPNTASRPNQPLKFSLKCLASRIIGREIQLKNGHDSKEDARAAMDIVLYYLYRKLTSPGT